MNITSKYGIQMICDQQGVNVPSDYVENEELLLIEFFEKIVLKLKKENKSFYSMIELGSNYAYYSMLFNKILEPYNKTNIMIEKLKYNLNRGKKHFQLNQMSGEFLQETINPSFTIDDIINKFNLNHLDVLHSDIDGDELIMLEGCKNSLYENKISYIILLTHGIDKHMLCKEYFKNFNYNLMLDYDEDDIGGDRLLIYKNSKQNNQ